MNQKKLNLKLAKVKGITVADGSQLRQKRWMSNGKEKLNELQSWFESNTNRMVFKADVKTGSALAGEAFPGWGAVVVGVEGRWSLL